ncbi:MAG: SDR family NAD(P)-dependent oxidoreductase [Cyclobacteriaceae bacterium]
MSTQIETLHLNKVLENHGQDMSGKVVAITGTTSGTGFVCARELARLGAKVLLLNRKSERAETSLRTLENQVPGAEFRAISCDLQRLESVQQAAEEIRASFDQVDVVVNNAGVMALKDQATVDGYDIQMQTNCISHFLLTRELFPLLLRSKDGRVVNHSSMARLGGPLRAEYFDKQGGNLGGDGTEQESVSFQGPRWERYHQTKLANCAFTYGLKERLDAAGITHVKSLLAHPGLALTNLQVTTAADGGMESDSELMTRAQTAEDGATGIIRAAMDPEANSGDFYGPAAGWKGYPNLLEPEALLLDPTNVLINWEGCEKAVGVFKV